MKTSRCEPACKTFEQEITVTVGKPYANERHLFTLHSE